ncbi:hypothetical protein AAFF_G00034250 [Aldrovandia affinis]|uniref:Uncharacterized protein n=1 Tax=Aldrovandia affinis TaxID=143900 RepID=A0AAD7S3N7_9TELE|nr:hypothetical protein AAFF_G00034250 [Aldrovandia affinis]
MLVHRTRSGVTGLMTEGPRLQGLHFPETLEFNQWSRQCVENLEEMNRAGVEAKTGRSERDGQALIREVKVARARWGKELWAARFRLKCPTLASSASHS